MTQNVLSFKVPDEVYQRFEELCKQLKLNKSEIAREMLERVMPELEELARAQEAIKKADAEKKPVTITFRERLEALRNQAKPDAFEPHVVGQL